MAIVMSRQDTCMDAFLVLPAGLARRGQPHIAEHVLSRYRVAASDQQRLSTAGRGHTCGRVWLSPHFDSRWVNAAHRCMYVQHRFLAGVLKPVPHSGEFGVTPINFVLFVCALQAVQSTAVPVELLHGAQGATCGITHMTTPGVNHRIRYYH
eukprot:jgi/Ulvmu1/200/UM001_0204.1